jgi:hypothetical protein
MAQALKQAWYISNKEHQDLANTLSEEGRLLCFMGRGGKKSIFGEFLYQNNTLKNVLMRKQRANLFLF